ncbi:ATP-binding protein [Singulisphaera sp. Ch08]|uniref:histidine kinase n=1 Tax=Singulisphaera sp. Ch08 TaxID=3120278 RepID=A0AAU7C6J0_9BACT
MRNDDRAYRYGVALLLILIGGLVVNIPIVREGMGTPAIVAIFLILLSALYGGLGPGLLTTGLIALTSLGAPLTSWRAVRLALFVTGGVSISLLAEALHAARRRAEESRQALSAVLTSIGDAVIATDKLGRVTFANPVASTLTGWSPEETVGQPLGEIFRITHEETRRPIASSVAKVLRDGVVVGLANHTLLIARDGTERPIHDSAAPIRDAGGEILGAVLVFRDDTERRDHERQMLEASRRKDEFLAMLAHELRNPMGSIKAAVAMLETPEAGRHLPWVRGVLNRQIGQLTRLLDDLLDVARITRGQIVLQTEPVDADLAIRQAIESARPLTEARGHRVDTQITPEPKRIEADRVRLEQVLVNLLGNAAKYTPTGGRIKVSSAREGADVVIRVEDNGIGIPPEMLPKIFDLFTQGERSLARTEGGLGVGLTIVKSLVERHGGAVTVQSQGLGQGSTFTVRFPALEVELPPADTPLAFPAKVDATHRKGTRILIVDDNKDLAQSLARLLRHVGHEVKMAYDGPEGIETARVYAPDVLLLDIGLPCLDGYEVARRLRREENSKRALIIAISGYGQEEDQRLSREAGIDHYLVKPVDIHTVATLISQTDRVLS